jgi:hypothetical protein
MRPSKYFYDKPLLKYLDSKTVPKKALFFTLVLYKMYRQAGQRG